MPKDPRIPAYLGRVLTDAGDAFGTCFQVSPGVVVTAWHVLDDLGRSAEHDTVGVDALNGAGEPTAAEVIRIDPLHDLAVLRLAQPLSGSVAGWFATDWAPLDDPVVVTGVVEVNDPGHEYGHLDAPGRWAGGTTRDRQVPLGRLSAKDVLKGMSGAPVRRISDDRVVGVVSARYNAADGWLQHSVWVARTEDVENLLAGVVAVAVEGAPDLGEAVDLVLSVTGTEVRLTGAGTSAAAPHRGVSLGLAAALGEVRRARAGAAGRTIAPDAERAEPAGALSLRRAGQLLAESFLPVPVADALARMMRRATAEHVPVRIGVDAPGWPGLPWEALPDPESLRPLALCPLVTVFRQVQAPKVRKIPGPLRILVAISAPERGGGPELDYERELRNVVAAVRGARAGDADVRVVPFATTAAIRAALDEAPAHVLHLSCHGGPGVLDLEDEEGSARAVTAEQLVEEAIPPGRMPPVICLAACYTDVPGEEGAPSLAASLVGHGASVAIGTETTVTDWYATALFARVYQELAQSSIPDVVAAVADARRIVQLQLATSDHPRESKLAALDEWSVVTVLAGSGSTPVFDPARREPLPEQESKSVAGLSWRGHGNFVGRRREQRALPAALAGASVSGVVLHGIGGVGKTTLAAELLQHLRFSVTVVCQGELSVDVVLTEVTSALRRHLAMQGGFDQLRRAVGYAGQVSEPWQDRFAALREQVLSRIPVLLVLDNFEDNLTDRRLGDNALAELLARWAADPGESRLLITSRYEFALPRDAHRHLRSSPVGPMSMAETFKLIWSLPALDRLGDDDVEKVWRLVGGHPRSLEYLDALLNHGHARYHDVTARLSEAIQAHPEAQAAETADTLDAALAQTVTLIADDVLLDALLRTLEDHPGARGLLLGASVYREPVGLDALLFQLGDVDEGAAHEPDRRGAQEHILAVLEHHRVPPAGLNISELPPEVLARIQPDLDELAARPTPPRSTSYDLGDLAAELAATSLLTVNAETGTVFVHRWTASALERCCHDDELQQAHRKAAEYWNWRIKVWPQDRDADLHDALEMRHHLIAGDELGDAESISQTIALRLQVVGAWDHELALIHHTLAVLARTPEQQAPWHHQLGILAQLRGDYAEAERRYDQALAIKEEHGDRAGVANGYHQIGMIAQRRGEYAEAERRYTESLAIREELGDRAGMATSYHQLGILAQVRGDYAEAERRYTESLAIKEELGNRAGMASSYGQLGILAQDRGDYAEAERRFAESLAIDEKLGNRVGMATSYHQLGMIAQDRGEYAEAERRYIESLAIEEELGNRVGVATSYHQLGILAQVQGEYAEAERRYTESFAIREEVGDRAGLASSHHQIGNLTYLRGDYAEAERRYTESIAIRNEIGDRVGLASSYHQLGMLAEVRGDYVEAERRYTESVAISEEVGNRAGLAISYHQLGNLMYSRGEYAEAERRYTESLAIDEKLGNRVGVATGYHQLGMIAQLRGEYAEAERYYTDSLAIKREIGNRADLAHTVSQLGILAEESGDQVKAVTLHAHAAYMRAQLQLSERAFDLRRLLVLRDSLGAQSWSEAITEAIGRDAAETIATALEDDALLDHGTASADGVDRASPGGQSRPEAGPEEAG
ncbi:tetratricopeptide repeat protein [Amycolatopsis sp. NPDC004625]|uniref:tetratricopeptide repeat protein n=1 Tax=Amycolatopsis sp. NPDC004625 TaxID=3154670 RepID=UPI0033B7D0A0